VIAKRGRALLSHELRTPAHQTILAGMSGLGPSPDHAGVATADGRAPHPMYRALVAVVRETPFLVIDGPGAGQRS
jgi:hypothetical protein